MVKYRYFKHKINIYIYIFTKKTSLVLFLMLLLLSLTPLLCIIICSNAANLILCCCYCCYCYYCYGSSTLLIDMAHSLLHEVQVVHRDAAATDVSPQMNYYVYTSTSDQPNTSYSINKESLVSFQLFASKFGSIHMWKVYRYNVAII